MELRRHEHLTTRLKGRNVTVQDVDSQEKGLVRANLLESYAKDLAHPVNHLRAESIGDVMILKVIVLQLRRGLEGGKV